jgi:hypothetical protein
MIGYESVSHQNLVRRSQVCMDCGEWNWLDEDIPVQHLPNCHHRDGDMVQLAVGGSQSRATVAPPKTANQEEAAAWPHV